MSVYENVTIGPARVFVAPAGTTLPTTADLAALQAGTLPGWRDVGHTTAAVEFAETPEQVLVTSQQGSRELEAFNSRYTTRVRTTMLERTAANIAVAIEGTVDGTAVKAPKQGVATKYALAFVGPAPEGETALFAASRCAVVGESGFSIDADNPSSVPVEFAVLDVDGDAYVIDVTVTASVPED